MSWAVRDLHALGRTQRTISGELRDDRAAARRAQRGRRRPARDAHAAHQRPHAPVLRQQQQRHACRDDLGVSAAAD